MIKNITLILAALFLIACSRGKDHSQQIEMKDSVYQEQHRLQVHFSPKANWMNDPNGMFYLDGEYHLFFQYYPDSTVWGPMHWGHAVSKDLMHWEELPIALYPDSLGYIFSGSAVVDVQNTSGLGSVTQPPIVALFTYHHPDLEKAGRIDFQYQGMAYSLDKGRSWKKYQHNPVLANQGIKDFRDPKVSWHAASAQWVMTLAVKDHIEFYGSKNLKQWSKLSEFGLHDGGHGGVWECPDLLLFNDESGKPKYVLLVSINPGAPNGGSGTQYFTGTFDGKKFVSDTPGKEAGWIDYGTDNYAGVTFNNIPDADGRTILMGWMSNWLYAQVTPTLRWRSAMTLPRTLQLTSLNGKAVLVSQPVKEIEKLVINTTSIEPTNTQDSLLIYHVAGGEQMLGMVSGRVKANDITFKLSNGEQEHMLFGFDKNKNEFFIDRTTSGMVDFQTDFAKRMQAPRISLEEWIEFKCVIDVGGIELFFDGGLTNMTALYFPTTSYQSLQVYSPNGLQTDTITVDELKRIW